MVILIFWKFSSFINGGDVPWRLYQTYYFSFFYYSEYDFDWIQSTSKSTPKFDKCRNLEKIENVQSEKKFTNWKKIYNQVSIVNGQSEDFPWI